MLSAASIEPGGQHDAIGMATERRATTRLKGLGPCHQDAPFEAPLNGSDNTREGSEKK